MISGGFAGFCSTLANTPIDVVKTVQQGVDGDKHGNPIQIMKHIMATEGFFGLYRGVGPRMTRVVVDVALTFSIFNSFKRALVNFMAKKD